MRISNTLGQSKECHIEILDDLGMFRAFWAAHGESTVSPVGGYCSAGGSHKTIKAAVAKCRRLGYDDPAYRNGRLIKG